MNSKLVIVHTANECSRLKKNQDTDFLVFTPEIMSKLDSYGIAYKTCNDFYDVKDFYSDTKINHKKVESLLLDLDNVCNHSSGFLYSYSGNALYFMNLMDELFYLDSLIEYINRAYVNIYVYSTSKPKTNPLKLLTYVDIVSSSNSRTISFPSEMSLSKYIDIIFNTLDASFISDRDINCKFNNKITKIRSYYGRLQGYYRSRYSILKQRFSLVLSHGKLEKKGKILIAQDGYEVASLKKYLTDFTLNTFSSIRHNLASLSPINIEPGEIISILNKFTYQNFVYLEKYVNNYFLSYHYEVVGRIPIYKKYIATEIRQIKPNVLLFSIGIRDVFDMIVASMSNDLKIPLIFFQHGGCLLFYKSLYKKYPELNSNIAKSFIINSTKEVTNAQHNNAYVIPMGSISRFEEIQKCKVAQTKDILFCTDLYIFNANTLLHNVSCSDFHKTSCDILSTIYKNSCLVDIKIHPVGQLDSYKYFALIGSDYKNTRILLGNPVEAIFKKYKLIILSYLGTSTLTTFLSYKVPVVLFIKNFDDLNMSGMENAKKDLINRCYIARDKYELNRILIEYRRKGLKSKWSKDFVDKYVYPVSDGNPGVNIANYIKSL